MPRTPSPPALGAFATVGATCALILSRPYDQALFRSAEGGGDWAEHLARVQTLQAWASDSTLRQFVAQTDTIFPPGLHWWMGALGSVVGHGEAAVGRTMVLWLVLLAASVGAGAWAITKDKKSSYLAGALSAAIPGVAAVSLTYYFDLPMTALLWAGAAALLLLRPRLPEVAGAVAGLFWFAAAITKWTALPFGVVMLGGALLAHAEGERWSRAEALRRIRAGAALAITTGLLVRWWFGITDVSWRAMSDNTMGDPGAWTRTGSLLDGLTGKLQPFSLDRLAAYPVDLATALFSPLLALLVLALIAVWAVRDRRGGAFVVGTAAGQWAVLFLLVPPADPRFLLTLAPVLVLAAVLGLDHLPARLRGGLAAAWIAVALLVIADVHHGSPNPLNARWSASGEREHGFLKGRGLSIDSTDAKTGWMRADMGPPKFAPDREELWAEVARCRANRLAVQEGALKDSTDQTWWQYRAGLARHLGTAEFASVSGLQGLDGDGSTLAVARTAPAPEWEPLGQWRDVVLLGRAGVVCDR
ncbi:MAG: hypothetical protein GY898_24935 [Proteobacteria bacterium]|nr:hypothetical protein [Pseudomonadota bacterium]